MCNHSRDDAWRLFETERPRRERSQDLAFILASHGVDVPDDDVIPLIAAITRWSDAHVSAGFDALYGADEETVNG